MAEVEVIKAVEGPILRKRDYEGKPLVITRQRVAAYVRVSTDDEEQLESFQSQKQSEEIRLSIKIRANKMCIYLRIIENKADYLIEVKCLVFGK